MTPVSAIIPNVYQNIGSVWKLLGGPELKCLGYQCPSFDVLSHFQITTKMKLPQNVDQPVQNCRSHHIPRGSYGPRLFFHCVPPQTAPGSFVSKTLTVDPCSPYKHGITGSLLWCITYNAPNWPYAIAVGGFIRANSVQIQCTASYLLSELHITAAVTHFCCYPNAV